MPSNLDYAKLSDHELYALYDQGYELAFDHLYQRYWKRLLYQAMLKLEAEDDAEEVVQDTLLDIWKSKGRLEIRNSFSTYISAMLRYKIMERMAAKRKQIYKTTDDMSLMDAQDDTTRQWLDFADLQEELEAAVQRLPEKCQLVFRMSREEDLNYGQIADKLDLSRKTVEAHITKALKLLRASFSHFFSLFLLVYILLIFTVL